MRRTCARSPPERERERDSERKRNRSRESERERGREIERERERERGRASERERERERERARERASEGERETERERERERERSKTEREDHLRRPRVLVFQGVSDAIVMHYVHLLDYETLRFRVLGLSFNPRMELVMGRGLTTANLTSMLLTNPFPKRALKRVRERSSYSTCTCLIDSGLVGYIRRR